MYGLLGKLSTESEDVGSATGEMSIHDEIMAEQAFDEASEIAHESAMLVTDMVQAESVAAQLDVQSALTAELLASPEQITPGAVAVSREAMVLALVALGVTTNDFVVSKESMISAPVQAMEVTHEGIGDTAKKIYEGIKMVFKKIALNIKKLAAKLVVALNGTGKKAEKMLKSFKAEKDLVAKKTTLEDADVEKLLSAMGGDMAADKAMGVTSVKDLFAKFEANLQAFAKMDDDVAIDRDALAKAAEGASGKTEDVKLRNALNSLTAKSISYEVAKSVIGRAAAKPGTLKGATPMTVANEDDLSISDEVEAGTVAFYPTYVKGNKVHGIVTYAKKLDDDEKGNVYSAISSFKYKAASVEGLADVDAIEATDKAVMKRGDIEKALGELKGASKHLKSFSDARMKDIEKVSKAIDKQAKAKSGLTIINRLAGTDFNNMRMFASTQHLSSIFALASAYKAELANTAKHISYYE